jgi:cytochrome c556
MKRRLRVVAVSVGVLALSAGFWACGGGDSHDSDNNLPTRRAMMREIKISTDRIMAVLKNRSLEGVEADARKMQSNWATVIDLYPPDHKAKYINYNKDVQQRALRLAAHAKSGHLNPAIKEFRDLVPMCNKCHEDCAYMLAPAFPEYEPE